MKEILIQTEQKIELIDITDLVEQNLSLKSGAVLLFLPHATAGFLINENEEGLKRDFEKLFSYLKNLAPFEHNKIDNNAEAHLMSGILKPFLILPVQSQKLVLGCWQRIFLVELDGPRERKILVKEL